MSECVEPYKECMATRTARVREVIEQNPYDSLPQLAEKAGVNEKTVRRERERLLQTRTPVQDCNKDWTPQERPTLDPIGNRPAVVAVKSALLALCDEELKYLKHWIKERKL
jgi:hypothetical protein